MADLDEFSTYRLKKQQPLDDIAACYSNFLDGGSSTQLESLLAKIQGLRPTHPSEPNAKAYSIVSPVLQKYFQELGVRIFAQFVATPATEVYPRTSIGTLSTYTYELARDLRKISGQNSVVYAQFTQQDVPDTTPATMRIEFSTRSGSKHDLFRRTGAFGISSIHNGQL